MRGDDLQQAGMFSYLSPEQRVPQDHPLRAIRKITEAADFSRSRNADLGRFTVDRLMSIINRLGSRVEVKIKMRRGGRFADSVPAARA